MRGWVVLKVLLYQTLVLKSAWRFALMVGNIGTLIVLDLSGRVLIVIEATMFITIIGRNIATAWESRQR